MAQETDNILEYAETQYDSFTERPLGDVDSLILSWLTYWQFNAGAEAVRGSAGMSLADLYHNHLFKDMQSLIWDATLSRHMLAALVANPRFTDMRIANYVAESSAEDEKQFSAMTFLFPDGGAYVAFRGTDGSIVGWKEDFNMAFETEVPSQRAAVDYLDRIASLTEGTLWTGGHSKGGNLAVYAAVNAGEAASGRLEAAFSHDGPGFTEETLSSEAWQAKSHLIRKTVPKDSIVGMLLERQEDYAVVASKGTGILQHDPTTWVVEGTDFKLEEAISFGARHVDAGINAWVSAMSREEREEFFDTLFAVFAAGGDNSFASIRENWQTSVPAMLLYVYGLEPERRERMTGVVNALVRSLIGEVPQIEIPQLDLSSLAGLLGQNRS